MSLSLIQDFASGVTGLTTSLGDGFTASGGTAQAVTPANAAAMSISAIQAVDCEVKVDLAFTTRAEAAVYAGLQTVSDFTSDHYRVQTGVTDANRHHIKIIKRLSGVEETLWSLDLVRGKYATADSIWIRKFLAGDRMVIQAYVNDIWIGEVVDSTSPITGAGYGGVWLAAASTGMGLDNLFAGDTTVKWVCKTAHTNPTQSAGSDSNAGTFAAPFATLKFGASNAQMTAAGQILVVRGDNHSERISEASADLLFRPGTSEDNRTQIQAYPGESVTNTYSGGTSQVSFAQSGGATKYLTWLNLSGVGAGRLLNSQNEAMNIRNGSTFIRVIGGSYSDFPNTGAIAGKALASESISNYHIEFIGVHVHHNGGILPNPGEDHGFYFSHPGTIFEDCEINDNAVHGLQIQPFPSNGDARADNCIVRRNRIHHNGGGINDNPGSSGGAIILSYADNCLFANNLIYRNRIGLAITSNSSFGAPPTDTLIYHNTIAFTTEGYGISIGVGSGSGADTTVSGTLVTNNVLWSNNLLGVGSELTSPPPSGTRADGTMLTTNLNDGNAGPDTDPLFVDGANNDYHLQATSPARHTVGGPYTNLSATVPHDFSGYPITSTPDIGAYQFEAAFQGLSILDLATAPKLAWGADGAGVTKTRIFATWDGRERWWEAPKSASGLQAAGTGTFNLIANSPVVLPAQTITFEKQGYEGETAGTRSNAVEFDNA